MKTSIVFIHGLGGGKYQYQPIIKFLKKNGDFTCYEFTYKEKFGKLSLQSIARDLHDYITKNIHESEITIIGLSQGGIIARYYIEHYCDKNVAACITLCTPHSGSWLAYLGYSAGIKELRPGSTFLKNLDTTKTRYYAVHNPFDLMVLPGWFAKLEGAQENKRVYSWGHPFTFWNKKTLQFIISILRGEK